jgi:hypothetical protein
LFHVSHRKKQFFKDDKKIEMDKYSSQKTHHLFLSREMLTYSKKDRKSSSLLSTWTLHLFSARAPAANPKKIEELDKFGYCIAPDENIGKPAEISYSISRTNALDKLWMP